VIVDQADRLHPGLDDDGAHKLEAALLDRKPIVKDAKSPH
jgi:hypothetical protein